jgi:chaperonin cofactor prefoldin
MGKKRSRIGNKLYLCIALLIFLAPLACTVGKTSGVKMVDTTGEEAAMHLALSRQFLAEGNYGRAQEESENILSLAGRDIPMAETLFNIGLIQAHPGNPARDDAKAMITFKRLITDYPRSPQADQAKAVTGLIQENEKLNRTVERLNSQVERLNGQVERSSSQMERLNSQVEKSNSQVERLNSQVEKSSGQMERLNNQMEKLNNIIDELKKVDIGVEQKKREKGR